MALVFPPDIAGWQGIPITHDTARYRLYPSFDTQVDSTRRLIIAASATSIFRNVDIPAGHRLLSIKILFTDVPGARLSGLLNLIEVYRIYPDLVGTTSGQGFLIGGAVSYAGDFLFELGEGWVDQGTKYQIYLQADAYSAGTAPFRGMPELVVRYMNPLQFEPIKGDP